MPGATERTGKRQGCGAMTIENQNSGQGSVSCPLRRGAFGTHERVTVLPLPREQNCCSSIRIVAVLVTQDDLRLEYRAEKNRVRAG
jgi:hypothetical protein